MRKAAKKRKTIHSTSARPGALVRVEWEDAYASEWDDEFCPCVVRTVGHLLRCDRRVVSLSTSMTPGVSEDGLRPRDIHFIPRRYVRRVEVLKKGVFRGA